MANDKSCVQREALEENVRKKEGEAVTKNIKKV